jgi:hypothetical protein
VFDLRLAASEFMTSDILDDNCMVRGLGAWAGNPKGERRPSPACRARYHFSTFGAGDQFLKRFVAQIISPRGNRRRWICSANGGFSETGSWNSPIWDTIRTSGSPAASRGFTSSRTVHVQFGNYRWLKSRKPGWRNSFTGWPTAIRLALTCGRFFRGSKIRWGRISQPDGASLRVAWESARLCPMSLRATNGYFRPRGGDRGSG